MARTAYARTDNSVLNQWWLSIDRWLFLAVALLIGIGIMLTMAASPPVAERIGLESFYFLKRHLFYIAAFFVVLIATSMLSEQAVRRSALLLYVVVTLLLIVTPIIGSEIKGAKRWINLAGFSVQPSEFMKPALVIITAWMLSEKKKRDDLPANIFAIIFYVIAVGLILLQPDMGMVFLMTAIFFSQFFLAGLPLAYIMIASATGAMAMVGSYFLFPHVQERVDRFLTPGAEDRFAERYQITQSLEAFSSGGFFGLGPGEGVVKNHLPDAHADFIFSVAAEEYGILLCIAIVAVFAFFVIRSVIRVMYENNLFVLLAVTGLVFEIGLQAAINMASTIDLIPTKGMTLPFISFGGSSILSVAITAGFVIALTRKQIKGRFK